MISGVEPLRPTLPCEPIYLEGRLPLLRADSARALGLHDAQVVQATVQDDARFMRLQLGGPALDLPRAWHAAAGSQLTLVVRMQPDGAATLQPASPQTAAAAATPAQAGSAAAAAGSAAAPYAAAAAPPDAAADTSSDVLRVLQRSRPHGLSDLLASGALGHWLDRAAAGNMLAPLDPALRAELLRLWRVLQRQLSALTPALLREAVLGSGLLHESLLLQGAAGGPLDLKALLRRLQRSLPTQDSDAVQELGQAVDDIESAQVQTVAAQMQGQVFVSVVIPFADAGPMELKFQRAAVSEEQPDPPFVVDVVARHTGLGPLWLRTAIDHPRVALTMWAERPAVAAMARAGGRDLQFELRGAGLDLVSFAVVEGARPTAAAPPSPPPAAQAPRRSAGIDLRA